jgi:hypothetical protein
MILLLCCLAGAHHARAGPQEHPQVLRMVCWVLLQLCVRQQQHLQQPPLITWGRRICMLCSSCLGATWWYRMQMSAEDAQQQYTSVQQRQGADAAQPSAAGQ